MCVRAVMFQPARLGGIVVAICMGGMGITCEVLGPGAWETWMNSRRCGNIRN